MKDNPDVSKHATRLLLSLQQTLGEVVEDEEAGKLFADRLATIIRPQIEQLVKDMIVDINEKMLDDNTYYQFALIKLRYDLSRFGAWIKYTILKYVAYLTSKRE